MEGRGPAQCYRHLLGGSDVLSSEDTRTNEQATLPLCRHLGALPRAWGPGLSSRAAFLASAPAPLLW